MSLIEAYKDLNKKRNTALSRLRGSNDPEAVKQFCMLDVLLINAKDQLSKTGGEGDGFIIRDDEQHAIYKCDKTIKISNECRSTLVPMIKTGAKLQARYVKEEFECRSLDPASIRKLVLARVALDDSFVELERLITAFYPQLKYSVYTTDRALTEIKIEAQVKWN